MMEVKVIEATLRTTILLLGERAGMNFLFVGEGFEPLNTTVVDIR